MSYSPKEHVQIAVSHLEDAVLDLLSEAKQKGKVLIQADIERLTGTYREWECSQWIIATILYKLRDDGCAVQQKVTEGNKKRGWYITEAGYEHRKANG